MSFFLTDPFYVTSTTDTVEQAANAPHNPLDLDYETAALIVKLAMEDLDELRGQGKGKARANAPLTDEEYALQVQSQQYQELLISTEDAIIAKSLQEASATDATYLEALVVAERAAVADRRAALALSRGEALPPVQACQRRLEDPAYQMHPNDQAPSSKQKAVSFSIQDDDSTLAEPDDDLEEEDVPNQYAILRKAMENRTFGTGTSSGSGAETSSMFSRHIKKVNCTTCDDSVTIKSAHEAANGHYYCQGCIRDPKYLRHNVWDPASDFTPTTADWTETAKPLPRPPDAALNDPIATKTVNENPELFKIVTPIKVARFRELLKSHPNPEFVGSVCDMIEFGAWPFADTTKDGYPSVNDESRPTPTDPTKAEFLRNQFKVEQEKNRFSPPFGDRLLPGMYSMPIFAVPKPHSTDLRMVTDQSHGDFSLNSMIEHDQVTGYPLDNLKHLGEMLIHLKKKHPDAKLVIWKSDVAEAYRNIPMHPFWQIKQANFLDGLFYIDRNNAFGGCGSGSLWIAFNSLVGWIAKHVLGIEHLGTYVDDSFGAGLADDMLWYEPYTCFFPREQTLLLQLWDELGVPHKQTKQVFGPVLPVIGIEVDANGLSFTLPEDAKEKLVDELESWCENGCRERLKRWFQMGGWMNWALNAHPLLRPALNNFYTRLRGRKDSKSQIWVDNIIRNDFEWALGHLSASPGIFLLESFSWKEDDATMTIYCDACPAGMGFWYPKTGQAFYSPTPQHDKPDLIFYFEALCVLSALYNAHIESTNQQAGRLLIFTDSANTADMFNTLRALPAYNHLLKGAVDLLLEGGHSLRVCHVPGAQNEVADALSHANFGRAFELRPDLEISPFEPWALTHN